MVRKTFLAAVCTVAIVGLSAGPAFAGEVTGTGKPTNGPANSNSPCSFSGLDDQDPGSGIVQPGLVQNYGHTKDTPAVISNPRGASDLIVDFGGGSFEYGCNGHIHGMK